MQNHTHTELFLRSSHHCPALVYIKFSQHIVACAGGKLVVSGLGRLSLALICHHLGESHVPQAHYIRSYFERREPFAVLFILRGVGFFGE